MSDLLTEKLTCAQAILKFLDAQYISQNGKEEKFVEACLGIFGHGNVAGIGQAIAETETLPYIAFRNEQAMVHTAVSYARANRRKKIYACTSSIGPGATNMITGAALASINRIPVLLLPGDYIASRRSGTLLQQWSHASDADRSVNDSFRSVSVYWDRITRPEQILPSLLEAMRVLTSPAETGAVTICLPQDVQVEAYDYPIEFFSKRIWNIARPSPDSEIITKALQKIKRSKKPIVIAGGGVRYSGANAALLAFVDQYSIPITETFAGKGSVLEHPLHAGAIGVTGTIVSNTLANQADLVIAIGTRMTDFATASNTLFQNPDVEFIHININARDAHGQSGLSLIGDARSIISILNKEGAPIARKAYVDQISNLKEEYQKAKDLYFNKLETNTQVRYIKALNEYVGKNDIVINASGSLPGELHQLWQPSSPDQLHIEYGYSCMGYEIPAGIGCSLSRLYERTYVLIGDGSYLMLPQEIVTAIQLDLTMTIIMMDNSGYGSIGQLSQAVGAQGIGTGHRDQSNSHVLKIDYIKNAESLGAKGYLIKDEQSLINILEETKNQKGVFFLYCQVPNSQIMENNAWWDVPIAEVSNDKETQKLRKEYEMHKAKQRYLLNKDRNE